MNELLIQGALGHVRNLALTITAAILYRVDPDATLNDAVRDANHLYTKVQKMYLQGENHEQ